MIDLTLLGCGGGMPMPNRYLSALCISYKGRKILVDCGEGTQVSMRMCNLGFKTIDIICITHIHGDHIVGLPGLLGTIGNSGRTEPLTIIGPIGITEAVKGLRVIANWLPYEINVIENPKETVLAYDDEIEIDTLEVDHSSPCIGYSFYLKRMAKFDVDKAIKNEVPKQLWSKLQKSNEEIEFQGKRYAPEMVKGVERKGIKISMITDTRPTEKMVPFIKESDLLVCEGTYGDDGDIEKAIKNKHMTFREAATLAKKAKVEKLLLTHFSTAMDSPEIYINNAIEVFKNTIIGEDRLELNLTFKE
ncbi:ribonuclease Z [Clostridium bornimense]|mgnify:FL=1|uniref:ribonuclease Z n=1 Tax=Clostridium bornimense TaxID=1216932 RepID=UPI001C1045F6|nr:ribonuclease Z [uncultured Clostridium sp.]MBU5316998.1 ribonuclease Z [Clostridium bornimense]